MQQLIQRVRARAGVRARLALVAGVAAASLLGACGASSENLSPEDFAAPPVEPIKVPGLDRCSAMVVEDSGDDNSDRLPQTDLPCLNERRAVDVSQLAGPAVINLLASWCGPCRKEMPMLAEAARDNPDVRFVGINTQDRSEPAADLLAKTGVTYSQLVEVDAIVLDHTRVPGLPVTLALDAEGRVVDRVIGEVSPDQLDTLLDSVAGPR